MTEIATTATCPACDGHAEVPKCSRCEAWVVQLPAAARVLTTNVERTMHWSTRNQIVQEWRATTGWVIRSLKLPRMQRIHVWIHWNAENARRRDPGNAYPTVKACIDGIVDAGVIPDDDSAHLIGPDIRLGHVCRPSTLTVAIVQLDKVVAP